MIAFQFSLVKKIESSIKEYEGALETSGINLKNHTLFEILRLLTDDSLIAVSRQGEIQELNSSAEKLLGAASDQFKGKCFGSL